MGKMVCAYRAFPILAAVSSLALVLGCDLGLFFRSTECLDVADVAEAAATDITVTGTKWLYQLQNADPDEIAATDFDILVIDYSRDGSDAGRYTLTEMETMKTSGTSRQVLAYLSIGEAEDYRYYFEEEWTATLTGQPADDAPDWLGRTNPDWAGNYKVQYWSEEWQEIVLDYLDTIIDDGFDGVYLDIVDAWEYWSDEGNREGFSLEPETAAARMINLVKRIARYARVERGMTGFLVFPQNGERILDYDTGLEGNAEGDFLAVISGIGVEDLFYNEDERRSDEELALRLPSLETIAETGKKVAVVDYVDDGSESVENLERIASFLALAEEAGFLPYVALMDRELDCINGTGD